MKKKKVILAVLISFFSFLFIGLIGSYIYYNDSLKPVDSESSEEIVFNVVAGTSSSIIISNLESESIIKNAFTLKIYARLHDGTPKAGRYVFTKSMPAKDVWNKIIEGKVTNDTVWVTFVEGKRLSYIKSQIAASFPYTEEEIDKVLDDKTYINELIEKYDILTDKILNDKIYHPLEGYLFPDTYKFMKDASIKDIIETMIKTMEMKLSAYSSEIENSKYSVHELLTLASIVELEGARSDDRNGVAGVFYNRLNNGWTLGSDVTTYYAVNKDFDKDLSWSDLNSCNAYNTRGKCVSGLPVGPIASPSINSIDAVMKPESHDYFYFVADKNGKTYFSKTEGEHNRIIRDLQSKGLWYTY